MEKIFTEVLNMSFQAGIVVCFILLARWVFSLCRVPKKYSYFLWLIPFVRFVSPVTLQSIFSLLPKETESFHETAVSWLEQSAQNTQILSNVPVLHQIDLSSLAPTQQYSADPLQILTGICSYIWVFTAVILAVYSLGRLFFLKKKLRLSIRLRDNIYLTDEINMPFVIGIVRPRIYLPSDLEEQELTYIILHEQTHIRRCDAVIKASAFLITLVHWFNPLAWAAFLCMGNDMEMSCDEAVMRKLGQEKGAEYAQTLLKLSVGRRRLQGITLAFGEGNTKGRVKNIMKYKRPLVITGIFALLVTAALVLGLLTDPLNGAGESEQETTVVVDDSKNQTETTSDVRKETAASEEETEAPVISYMSEGMHVEEPAKVFAGEGYVILFPADGWRQNEAGSWISTVNDKVRIQISQYDNETIPTEEELVKRGFESVGDAALPLHVSRIQEGICEHILHCASENNTWRIFYYYPEGSEYEEGFGTILRVIASTFTPLQENSSNTAPYDETITQIEITTPEISRDMSLGADGAILDYADNGIIIFHGYFGLFVYSMGTQGMVGLDTLKEMNMSQVMPEGIIGAVDLQTIGCQYTQGDNYCEVKVSADGGMVYLHPQKESDMYVYDVYNQILTKRKYSLEGVELFDSYVSKEEIPGASDSMCSPYGIQFNSGNQPYYGYLVSHDGTLLSLEYVEYDMVVMLFAHVVQNDNPVQLKYETVQ